MKSRQLIAPHPRADETNGDRNRAEPFTAQPSPHPQEVLVLCNQQAIVLRRSVRLTRLPCSSS
jgi:hypothetical protein